MSPPVHCCRAFRRAVIGVLWVMPIWLHLACAQVSIPPLSAHVIDTTNTLNIRQQELLEQKLVLFEQTNGAQIVLLLVPTTAPQDIASYALRVGNFWKIGRKTIGDGLLVIVAKNDRQIRIEVSKALEGAIPDLAAKRIIEQSITPHFKQADYWGGLDLATDQMMQLIAGEALPAPAVSPQGKPADLSWTELAVFVFMAVPVIFSMIRRIFGAKLGAVVTGGFVGGVALLMTSSMVIAGLAAIAAMALSTLSNIFHSNGVGWRTGGRGGFGSGGGGDFGGGGASGKW